MSALAKHDEFFSREQIETIKNVICPGLTDPEVGLFSEVCKQTKLSPFAKQIYVTKRPTWDAGLQRSIDKMTIQTGIDGYRLIAERTGKYNGQSAFEWCGADGIWKDVWLGTKPPAAARATIHRSDWAQPVVRVARWEAYVQTKKGGEPNSMWAKMGPEQLAKCAEALALRTAFPQELSGLYTDEEMGQADNEPAPRRQPEVRATVVEKPREPEIDKALRRSRACAWPVVLTPELKAELDARITAPVEGPRFPTTWKHEDGEWAGRLMSSAGADTLTLFLDDCAKVQDHLLSPAANARLQASITAAEAALAALIDAETGEVRDPIADKLQHNRDIIESRTKLDPNDHSYLDQNEASP